jgi:hypothetical protein
LLNFMLTTITNTGYLILTLCEKKYTNPLIKNSGECNGKR